MNEYIVGLTKEGISSIVFSPGDFRGWFQTAPRAALDTVQGFLLCDCEQRLDLSKLIQKRSRAPIIAMIEVRCLAKTLDLFSAGIDDVVRKPVHVREILARAEAVWRRSQREVAMEAAVDRTDLTGWLWTGLIERISLVQRSWG